MTPLLLYMKLTIKVLFTHKKIDMDRKIMTNLDSILKSRDITLPTKVHLVMAMVFPTVMYGCEGWTVKKAECRRIDVFFFFNIFNFTLFYFTILYWFCHTSTWIHHRYTRFPHPEAPTHILSCTIPLGHLSAPAPNIQYHAWNLDWWLISYMILYMFQCHSPKSSHPMGREEGGGFRMGNTCTPMVNSCWCIAKPIQYCKVK